MTRTLAIIAIAVALAACTTDPTAPEPEQDGACSPSEYMPWCASVERDIPDVRQP